MKMLKCGPRAFARCPYRKECSDSPEHTSFYEGTECDYFNQQVIHAPLTNADRIRAMSDEELAKLLLDGCIGAKCDSQPQNEYGSVNCFECRMKWLQQPAKED